MELLNKDLILREIPLFAGLSETEHNIIEKRSSLLEHKKGEVIYEENSPQNAFYCLVTGRVVVYTQDQQGKRKILEYLHRGKYFGIISLLTGDPHSVTAQAINDSLLLVIKKDDFDFILHKIPRLAIDLSKTLSRRLKRKDVHQKTIFESTIISVFSSYSHAGKTVYALNLALSLAKETHKQVAILDITPGGKVHGLPQKMEIEETKAFDLSGSGVINLDTLKDFTLKSNSGIDLICFSYEPEDESCVKRLMSILSLLVNDYHYLVLDLATSMNRSIFNTLNQSDLIHILSSPEPVDLKKTRNLIDRLKTEFSFPEDKVKILINEYNIAKLTHQKQFAILGKKIFATLPKIDFGSSDRLILDNPDCEYAKVVRRIARQLGDCLVGLVLGVGVGYGFCHLGVLKVLEEENIPIDVIAGSSIGALIASLWATGKSSEEILQICKEFKEPKKIWGLIDLTFPRLGLIKGNKLRRFLKKYLNNKTFYNIKLPLKIIASDVKRKEPKVLDRGSLVDAIMVSCAMPGVFTPSKFKEDILFDGGIINPLPTEPLMKMGVKKIIAVNVTPSREDIRHQYDNIKKELSVASQEGAKKRSWFNLKEKVKNRFKTNILDIIFRSIEIMQSEIAQKEAQLADVVLHPDTSGLNWLDLHKAAEFAARGEEEMRKNLDKIWEVVNE